ncbi:lysin [Vibrio phage vB_VpM-pA2SJ1]|uniref:Lysin n=1 Tax=Vibrio phage vB_VpM-pA2SJ1 TaxID=3095964 RepID=A0AAX4J5T9_9CAUD
MMIFDHMTVHASATPPSLDIGADWIRAEHLKRGWSDIGYHFVIKRDGMLEPGRPLSRTGAHVYGHNRKNLGVCLVGGVDEDGNPENNFTEAQFEALRVFISDQCGIYGIPLNNIKGHRDWSPDLNADGKISPNEYIKACPCFDVQEWLRGL